MASALPVSVGKEISLLLFGKIRHGKSATGNTILGWEAFRKSDNSNHETKIATLNCSVTEDGTVVRVVDTPGIMYTEKQEESTISEIMEGMSLCPNGFHALLFVIRYGIRYTREEIERLEIVKKYFGSRFLKDFGIVVMTHGDCFDLNHDDNGLTFDSWLINQEREEHGDNFDKLLQECNNRCVLFYNSGTHYINQRKQGVKKLFKLVEQMPKVYTSDQLELARTVREDLIKNVDTPVLYIAVLEKLSLLMDQIKKDLRNNTFSYEFMLQKIKALNEEVDDVGGKIEKQLEFLLWKEKLDSILTKVEAINKTGERGTQRAQQKRLLKDLQSLIDPPTRFQILYEKLNSIYNYFLFHT